MVATEKELLKKFLEPLRVSKRYKPKLGMGRGGDGVSLDRFLEIYSADTFYSWCGLDSGLMYAAHKAAGGMTSVYRQIGKGCENLFREIIIDSTGYIERASAEWFYTTQTSGGKTKKLSLDGRLELSAIENEVVKQKVTDWMRDYCASVGAAVPEKGVVFEVRQGYKSKDSKRQNGDIDNVAVAWSQGYMPVFAVFSAQIDESIVLRYRNNRAGIIIGTMDGTALQSLFTFTKEVLGFDLAGFFERNSPTIQAEVHETLEILLNASD